VNPARPSGLARASNAVADPAGGRRLARWLSRFEPSSPAPSSSRTSTNSLALRASLGPVHVRFILAAVDRSTSVRTLPARFVLRPLYQWSCSTTSKCSTTSGAGTRPSARSARPRSRDGPLRQRSSTVYEIGPRPRPNRFARATVKEVHVPKANRGGWKTCSRGHKYRGSFCAKCHPGRARRVAASRNRKRNDRRES
jgi:hypothetical protein